MAEGRNQRKRLIAVGAGWMRTGSDAPGVYVGLGTLPGVGLTGLASPLLWSSPVTIVG